MFCKLFWPVAAVVTVLVLATPAYALTTVCTVIKEGSGYSRPPYDPKDHPGEAAIRFFKGDKVQWSEHYKNWVLFIVLPIIRSMTPMAVVGSLRIVSRCEEE
jgi:hypothetical protein